MTSEGLARLFCDNIWKLYGLPRCYISDRASTFLSNFSQALNKLLGIKHNASTAYHPQTDDQTERVNQEIEEYLRIFINGCQSDWAEWLAMAEFAYNNTMHASTGLSPFFINYGKNPQRAFEPARATTSRIARADDFALQMALVKKETSAALKLAAEKMVQNSLTKRTQEIGFNVGDSVLLDASNISSSLPSAKLGVKCYGPFKILKKVGNRSYQLRLPISWRIHDVFHKSKLSNYTKPAFLIQNSMFPTHSV